MARRYTRDARGRFSSGGGGGSRGGASKPIQRGTNRLTRDNAGRITSQGGNGATARGGRLATASGNKRAAQTERLAGGRPGGTIGKTRKTAAKPSRGDQQRQIATQMKKDVRSKNVQATRILQRMAARDGHGGDVKSLTSQRSMSGNKWSQRNKGNELAADRSRELMFDHAPTRALVNAATTAASRGRVSQRRLDVVLKASGSDYMSVNRGYDRAVSRAKAAQSKRRSRK